MNLRVQDSPDEREVGQAAAGGERPVGRVQEEVSIQPCGKVCPQERAECGAHDL